MFEYYVAGKIKLTFIINSILSTNDYQRHFELKYFLGPFSNIYLMLFFPFVYYQYFCHIIVPRGAIIFHHNVRNLFISAVRLKEAYVRILETDTLYYRLYIMNIELIVYRMRIGLFYCCHLKVKGLNYLSLFELLIILSLLLLKSGDIQPNTGPDSEFSFIS